MSIPHPIDVARDLSDKLPTHWKTVKFGDVCKVQGGFAFKSVEYKKEGIPLVRISNLVNAKVSFESDTVYLSESTLSQYREFVLRKGDTLIAMSGATTGKMATFDLDKPALLNQRVGRFRILADSSCSPRFISLVVTQITKKVLNEAYGAAQPNISPTQIEQMEIPLPPLAEQQMLVAEIEKHFTRLEAGVAALRRAQANLKRYRAAVLKAACEGRLVPTEAELAKVQTGSGIPPLNQEEKQSRNGCATLSATFETGEQLLQRILTERRKNWNGRGKYKEPAAPNTANLPQLPDGWVWSRIGHLFECIVPNRDKPKSFTGDIPWITLADFSEKTIIRTASAKIGLSKEELQEYHARLIPSGSVVMSCIGRFGLAAKLNQDSVINQQLHAFVVPHFLPSEYYVYALRAQKAYMESTATSTTIAYLNKDNCNSVPIPLPPLVEQTRIVAEVERRLSVVEELEAMVSTNLQRATRLRQSILKKAFSGTL